MIAEFNRCGCACPTRLILSAGPFWAVGPAVSNSKQNHSSMCPIEQRDHLSGRRLQLRGHKVCRMMEDRMPQTNEDRAANLHIYAAHAHTFAAAAHRRGDHEAAEELSLK